MAQAPPPNAPQRPRLGDYLIKEGLVTQTQLLRALEEQKSFGGRLGRHLVELGFISDAVLQDALTRHLGFTRIDLDAPGAIASEATRYVRADLAEQWGFCPVEFDTRRNLLVIAMSDPDPQLITDIEGFLAMKVEVRVATAEAIDRASRRMFHGDGSPVKQMMGLQIARAEQRTKTMAASLAEALGPPPGMPPPQQPPQQQPPQQSYEAQLAQQLALQQEQMRQQLQAYQLQQMQLHAQVVQPAYPGGGQYPAPPRQPPQYQVPPPPQAPPPPPEPANPAGFLPYSPASLAAVEQLGEQVRKLEKTMAAQARALRTLVEILVEKGVLSKAEMLRKQQSYEK